MLIMAQRRAFSGGTDGNETVRTLLDLPADQTAKRGLVDRAGLTDAFTIPGFVPEYIRPLFCEGKGPFRWVALSGDAADIARTDRLVLDLFPHDAHLRTWIEKAQEKYG